MLTTSDVIELLRQGIERQRVPGHLVPRGVHGGVSAYEFLAVDIKTHLPKTRHNCTFCLIIVCLYSMRRHTLPLLSKAKEYVEQARL